MKKTAICFCIFLLMSLTSAVYAVDGLYSCDSDPADFNGTVFDNLTFDTSACDGSTATLEDIIITGEMIVIGGSIFFAGSDLNRVHLNCPAGSHCEIGLDGDTGLKELELYPGVGSLVTVSGLIHTDVPTPSFYIKGYLCEGQPEFAAYADVEISIDYQLRDLETFADLGMIDTVRIYAADDSARCLPVRATRSEAASERHIHPCRPNSPADSSAPCRADRADCRREWRRRKGPP